MQIYYIARKNACIKSTKLNPYYAFENLLRIKLFDIKGNIKPPKPGFRGFNIN